jgi:hypothetical protein
MVFKLNTNSIDRIMPKQLRDRRHLVFTEKNVKTLPVRRKQYVIWDGGNGRGAGEVCRGLYILISPMGAKSSLDVLFPRLSERL